MRTLGETAMAPIMQQAQMSGHLKRQHLARSSMRAVQQGMDTAVSLVFFLVSHLAKRQGGARLQPPMWPRSQRLHLTAAVHRQHLT